MSAFRKKTDVAPDRILSFLFQQFRSEVVHFTQQTSHWAVGITAENGSPLFFKFAIGFCLRPGAVHQALEFVQKCPWIFPHWSFLLVARRLRRSAVSPCLVISGQKLGCYGPRARLDHTLSKEISTRINVPFRGGKAEKRAI